jgi:hypothetical protein
LDRCRTFNKTGDVFIFVHVLRFVRILCLDAELILIDKDLDDLERFADLVLDRLRRFLCSVAFEVLPLLRQHVLYTATTQDRKSNNGQRKNARTVFYHLSLLSFGEKIIPVQTFNPPVLCRAQFACR